MVMERDECRQEILSNLRNAFRITLHQVIDELNLGLQNAPEHFSKFVLDTYQDVLQKFEDWEVGVDPDNLQTLMAAIQIAYSDDRIQEIILKDNEYCLHDNFQ